MIIESNALLVKEWQSLHNSHERYEQYALIIKLFSVAVTLFSLAFYHENRVIILILTILWLQEGIWKTYQARTCYRIELIEQALLENNLEAFQFYRQWSENRPSSAGLVMEYLKTSLKPTILYPYIPLIFITLIAQ
ncbi:hypothetical protein [Candidatus Colwellia aromaticivorans]|uniref:hypothetical protein n=1 Tax=Candidatus Colwellia aromaticivorans TaxID=2267621 RepID=UPI000DF3F674|nr:hypothetical protein [Candidatus Colwellia aromaticivorans]